MNTKFFSFIIVGLGMVIAGILLTNAFAQTASNIQYPVKELGNCQDEASCRAYCDKPQNLKVCLNFAEKNNLMSPEELQQAKKFLAIGGKGPGGCTGKDSCEEYCNDISHIDECVSFAEKNNLMPPEELAEAKKVQAAIKQGVKPPPCKDKKQCDVYCNETEHMEECIAFGIEAGFIQGEELEGAQKMLAALKRGVKPLPCKGKEACDEYCSNPDNMEACMNFAIEAGFMNEQEKQDSQKMLQAIKKGVKPPNCKGKEECDIYCSSEEHFEECTNFAVAAGFMSPEDAEMARKTGGKGPGGCKKKEECEAFCNNPDNQEICFNFAKEHGMIPEEDLRKMEEGKQKLQEVFRNAPPEVLECLKSTVGTEIYDKIQAGTLMPGPQIGDQVRQCFEQFMPRPPEGTQPPERGMPPEGMTGPGGCKSMEECQAYCSDPAHFEECQKFMPRGGERPEPSQEGRGMRQEGPGPVQGVGPEAEKTREEVLQKARTMVQESLSRLTPEMKECVISRLGQSVYDKLQAGDFSGFTQQDSENIQRVTIECVQQFFKPQPPSQGMPPPPSGEPQQPPEQITPGQPPSGSQPSSESQPPPPPSTEPPPPSTETPAPTSIISPQFILGLIFNALNLEPNY